MLAARRGASTYVSAEHQVLGILHGSDLNSQVRQALVARGVRHQSVVDVLPLPPPFSIKVEIPAGELVVDPLLDNAAIWAAGFSAGQYRDVSADDVFTGLVWQGSRRLALLCQRLQFPVEQLGGSLRQAGVPTPRTEPEIPWSNVTSVTMTPEKFLSAKIGWVRSGQRFAVREENGFMHVRLDGSLSSADQS